ncbi:hypothetical protein EPN81_01895 [Patescibacteria group bacterium]|nr:MAG: hypothetical protein EPN81_01895 [Patescibacteria group bacterium]
MFHKITASLAILSLIAVPFPSYALQAPEPLPEGMDVSFVVNESGIAGTYDVVFTVTNNTGNSYDAISMTFPSLITPYLWGYYVTSVSTVRRRIQIKLALKETFGFSLADGQSTVGLLRYTNAPSFRIPSEGKIGFEGEVSPTSVSGEPIEDAGEPEPIPEVGTTNYYDPSVYLPTGEILLAESHMFTAEDHLYAYFNNSGVQQTHAGVWDQSSFVYDLSDRPKSWAIALVHTSQILKQILQDPAQSFPPAIALSPHAVMATALKESALGSYHDGYFQIESGALTQLKSSFPALFEQTDYDQVIAYDNFETSAISRAYYDLFMLRRFLEYRPDAMNYLGNLEDATSFHKLINIAYNRGGWHPALDQILNNRNNCATTDVFGNVFDPVDVLQCLDMKDGEDSPGVNSFYDSGNADEIAYDHALAIVNYTAALDQEAQSGNVYDVAYTLQDFLDYAYILKDLYPSTDLTSTITSAFNAADTDHDGGISFRTQAGAVIDAMILALPAGPRNFAEIQALNPW